MLRQIVSRLEDSVSRLGVARKASKTPILNTAFPERGLFPELCSTSIFPPNEVFLPFSFCHFQTSEPTWSSWASPLLHLIIFEFLHCISFPSPPPHPRRGDLCHHWQAFALKILLLQSSHLNLATRQNSGPQVRTRSRYHVRGTEHRYKRCRQDMY